MKKVSKLIGLSFLGIILFHADLNLAQASSPPFAYPSLGQNAEEQQQDHFACYTWAKQQTGIAPAAFSAQTAQSPPNQGGAVRGAAGGAIGGNAGEGAAIGAGIGAKAWIVSQTSSRRTSTASLCPSCHPRTTRCSTVLSGLDDLYAGSGITPSINNLSLKKNNSLDP